MRRARPGRLMAEGTDSFCFKEAHLFRVSRRRRITATAD